jgi:3-methylfumaryl-CoA hydratase
MSQTWEAWIGRSQSQTDVIDAVRSRALLSVLGYQEDVALGDALHLLHHWLYFWEPLAPIDLGEDGHPKRGGFLPPVELPRRMWAGGRLIFHQPLCIGQSVQRISTIKAVSSKAGRSGELVFATVRHEISGPLGPAITEEQDLVYCEKAVTPSAPSARTPYASQSADWREIVSVDPILLFRYSALTFNSHRIHYDQPYATAVEGYPGLIVHGPLQATLLASLFVRHLPAEPSRFEFKGQAPASATSPLRICGKQTLTGASLWSEQDGRRCMSAEMSF